ncbi:hypothetical protein FBU30_007865 [Linnemannia zychae]|nr:hypothetical protein FBU30_007865 [Linnemannia zychae]
MKVYTLVTLLLAVATSLTSHATPTPPSAPLNGTMTDDSELLASVVDYDEDAASVLIDTYEAAFTGVRSSVPSRVFSRAAASSFIMPICIGIAANPVRTQLFSNQIKCDQDGWKTLFVFTAYVDPDPYQGFNKTCVAYALNPTRSMIFPGTLTCNQGEWIHDFSFYQSGCVPDIADNGCERKISQSQAWQAYGPHRTLTYPFYFGNSHGWLDPITMQNVAQWRYAKKSEWASFQNVMGIHAVLHSRITMATPPDDSTRRCLRNLFYLFPWGSITTAKTWPATTNPFYAYMARRDACSHLVNTSSYVITPDFYKGYGAVNVVINGKIYASVTVPLGWEFNRLVMPMVLEESLRTRSPVPIGSTPSRPQAFIAMVQKKFVVMGSLEAYNEASPIPLKNN